MKIHDVAHLVRTRPWRWCLLLCALIAIGLGTARQQPGRAAGSGWQVAPASTPAPIPRSQYGMVADGQGHLFLYGGNDYGGTSPSKLLGDFWEYDAATGDWQSLASGPVPPLVEPHLAVDAQGNVWEFGGVADPGAPHLSADGHSYGLYEYQPALDTWSDRTASGATPGENWPPGREDHGFAFDSSADALVVFAGEGPGGGVLNDMWTYSIQHASWTQVSPHYARSGGVAIAAREIYNISADAHGDLYLFGGAYVASPSAAGDNAYANDLWRYDDATQTWTLLSGVANGFDDSIPIPRHYYGQTVDAAGDFDILGGYVDAPESPPFFSQDPYASYAVPIQFPGETIPGADALEDFWRYDPSAGWQDLHASLGVLANSPMIPYVMVNDQATDRLYTFGGFRLGQDGLMEQVNTLWYLDESGSGTPTPTVTVTPTTTVSPNASATATGTVTGSPTPTATSSATRTATGTRTATATPTRTATGTRTATPSPTGTRTPTSTVTSTATRTATAAPTASATSTSSATGTRTATTTDSPTPSATGTVTPSLTGTPTTTGTATPTSTATPRIDQIAIAQGWNLISLPLQPATPLDSHTLLATLLARSGGRLAALYAMTNNGWSQAQIDNNGTFNNVPPFVLQMDTGYLLYSDQQATYRVQGGVPDGAPTWQVAAGWNLVGLPEQPGGPPAPQTILSALLARSGGRLAALYGLTAGAWSPSLIDDQGRFTAIGGTLTFQPGQGYLLYSDRAVPTFAPGAPSPPQSSRSTAANGQPASPPSPPALPGSR